MMNIQNFSSVSASADRVLLDENAKNGPELREAAYSFKDKAVFFLAKLPLLKNMEFVKSHLNKLDLENKTALGVFLNALSKCYGSRGASAAFEALKGPAPALNAQKIKELSSIAQDLCGRGDAKPLARQAVVRIWPNTPMKEGGPWKGQVGHASITVKNKMEENAKKQINAHISWWPGTSVEGTKNRFFAQRPGISLKDYKEDKKYEISERTVERLKRGENAAKRLATGDASPQDREDAKYTARANQKKDKNGNWGVIPQKVYLPLVGKNKDKTNRSDKSFSLFGLSEKNMIAGGEKAKSDAKQNIIGYTMASKTENCASMVARMMKSGGSENFSKFESAWISEDPNKIHEYAKTVQNEVDKLNGQAKKLETLSAELKKGDWNEKFKAFKAEAFSPFQKELSDLKEKLNKNKDSKTSDIIKSQIKETLDKQTSGISSYFKTDIPSKYGDTHPSIGLKQIINSNAPNSKDNFDSLIAKAKAIVTALNPISQNDKIPSDEKLKETIIMGQATLDKLKEFIEL